MVSDKVIPNPAAIAMEKIDHYENTPMQYTVILHGCKDNNFQIKNCDIFLILAVIIYRGYTLEPPQ